MESNAHNIKKLLKTIQGIEQEKLFHLSNQIEQELKGLSIKYPLEKEITLIKEKFGEIKTSILHIVKKETDYILPSIEKVIEEYIQFSADAYAHYLALEKPVEELIIEERLLEEKCEGLKQMSYNYMTFRLNDFKYKNVLMRIFELYQLFEKHVYIKQNIILPWLVQVFEPQDTLNEIESKNGYMAKYSLQNSL